MPVATKTLNLFGENSKYHTKKTAGLKKKIPWVDVSDDEGKKRKRSLKRNSDGGGTNGHARHSNGREEHSHKRRRDSSSSVNGINGVNGSVKGNNKHFAENQAGQSTRASGDAPSAKFAALQEQRKSLPIAKGMSRNYFRKQTYSL